MHLSPPPLLPSRVYCLCARFIIQYIIILCCSQPFDLSPSLVCFSLTSQLVVKVQLLKGLTDEPSKIVVKRVSDQSTAVQVTVGS